MFLDAIVDFTTSEKKKVNQKNVLHNFLSILKHSCISRVMTTGSYVVSMPRQETLFNA